MLQPVHGLPERLQGPRGKFLRLPRHMNIETVLISMIDLLL